MELTPKQKRELEALARRGQPAYVRTKALVLCNRGEGRSVQELSRLFRVSRTAIYDWQRRYAERGVESLWVQPGRGPKARAKAEELARYVLQSPRRFGVERTRWTLQALAQTVPCLEGFSAFGVQKALARAGFGYKRGQPHLHSPDPQYEEKKGSWRRR